MSSTYSSSFIRDEFDKKFTRLNKKLTKMKDGNQVSIVSEKTETKKILTPEANSKPSAQVNQSGT
jgi:hypothetical protein